MEIRINFLKEEECIHNLSFIKALLIKHSIEKLDIDYYKKEELRKRVLKELKKT